MTTGKTIALTRQTFVGKVMSLLLNMLSRLVITFLPRNKRHNFMAAITICSAFGAQKNNISHCFQCFPIYLPWSDGTRCHDLSFLNVELKATFPLSSFTCIKRVFSSSSLSAIRVVSSAYLRLLMFLPASLIPACASFSPAFRMMYSAFKLNKQGDSTQPVYCVASSGSVVLSKVVPCPLPSYFITAGRGLQDLLPRWCPHVGLIVGWRPQFLIT